MQRAMALRQCRSLVRTLCSQGQVRWLSSPASGKDPHTEPDEVDNVEAVEDTLEVVEEAVEEPLGGVEPDSREEILREDGLKDVLQKHRRPKGSYSIMSAGKVELDPPQLRVDVWAHLRLRYDVLIPSNIFPTVQTVGEAADYVISQIHPPKTAYERVKSAAPQNLILNVQQHKPRTGTVTNKSRSKTVLPEKLHTKKERVWPY
mmetsp:Transcript_359/g.1205  ORF Transcript_359/g.1205 Transcript_359/m.1205 type:complete len:204 (+) Transcript_359:66-677(+)